MGKIVRVGNLGSVIDAVQLKEIFSEIGNVVHVRLAESQYSGTLRGFGFVEMESDKLAADCVMRLNGKEHAGRVLAVSAALGEKSKAPKKGRSK